MCESGAGINQSPNGRRTEEPRLHPADAARTDLPALLSSVANGDQSAFSVIHERLAAPLYRVARRILRSHECAQEIVCDVFVHLWQNASTYDLTKGTVHAWLASMTRNRAIDRLRSYRRHRLVNERLTFLGFWTDTAHPDDMLTQFENITSLRKALTSLSSLRQQMLALAYFEGLSHEEISSRVALPLGTVKSHLRRALHALHAKLERGRREDGDQPRLRRRRKSGDGRSVSPAGRLTQATPLGSSPGVS